jgi:hypothetical protein
MKTQTQVTDKQVTLMKVATIAMIILTSVAAVIF